MIEYLRRACLVPIALFLACTIHSQSGNFNRKPLLAITDIELKYKPTGTRLRKDPATDQLIEYAVNGKIRYDPKRHNYQLEWTGYDGGVKQISWVPPNKLNAIVSGGVRYDVGARLFEYSYQVLSLPTSEQKLQSLYVTSQAEAVRGRSPDETWYSSPFTPYLRKVFKATDGWTWSQTMAGRLGLEPGETTNGFIFLSPGVPTLAKCYIRGYTMPLQVREDVPEELMDTIDRAAWDVPSGYTIAPGLPPDKSSAQLLIANMSQAMHIGAQEGWFAKEYDVKTLRRSIDEMRDGINSANNDKILRFARKISRLVDVASPNQICPELGQLLKYNIEILKEKVQPA